MKSEVIMLTFHEYKEKQVNQQIEIVAKNREELKRSEKKLEELLKMEEVL